MWPVCNRMWFAQYPQCLDPGSSLCVDCSIWNVSSVDMCPWVNFAELYIGTQLREHYRTGIRVQQSSSTNEEHSYGYVSFRHGNWQCAIMGVGPREHRPVSRLECEYMRYKTRLIYWRWRVTIYLVCWLRYWIGRWISQTRRTWFLTVFP